MVLLQQAENKFKCPCHGSQYDSTGKKIRGPAPLVSGSDVQQQHLAQISRYAAAVLFVNVLCCGVWMPKVT
jgi:phenylpropionate dioxygenase-like ring-hydroxylating dioxygenase large terminal subunit